VPEIYNNNIVLIKNNNKKILFVLSSSRVMLFSLSSSISIDFGNCLALCLVGIAMREKIELLRRSVWIFKVRRRTVRSGCPSEKRGENSGACSRRHRIMKIEAWQDGKVVAKGIKKQKILRITFE
jgi:hypothetical protein